MKSAEIVFHIFFLSRASSDIELVFVDIDNLYRYLNTVLQDFSIAHT